MTFIYAVYISKYMYIDITTPTLYFCIGKKDGITRRASNSSLDK